MNGLPKVIYLHGLGSSPESAKASLIRQALEARRFTVSAPVLSLPCFERLSVHAAVARVRAEIENSLPEDGIILVASSFGAFLAIHSLAGVAQALRNKVRGMVLLAPVFYPWHESVGLITPEVEQVWAQQGVYPLHDSRTGLQVPVHYGFVMELKAYSTDDVALPMPVLLIHGLRDATVPYLQSQEFAAKRHNVEVTFVDDDHQLLGDPPMLVKSVCSFIRQLVEKPST